MKIETLEKELLTIYRAIVNREFVGSTIGDYVHPHNRQSVMNMLRYITLRSHDLRKVHDNLSEQGITSLRSSESYVYRNITDALKLVFLLQGKEWIPKESIESMGYKKSKKHIALNSNELFNKKERIHSTEIMVTIPVDAMSDEDLIRDLLRSGMEIARIDLSKGLLSEWLEIIEKIKQTSREIKSPCKILADLPKKELKIEDFRIIKKSMELKNFINIKSGDHIILSTQTLQANACKYGNNRELITPAILPVTNVNLNEVTNVGDRIILSKGHVKGIILSKSDHEIKVLIKQTHKPKSKIYANSPITVPDSNMAYKAFDFDPNLVESIIDKVDIIGIAGLQSHKDVSSFLDNSDILNLNKLGLIIHIDSNKAWLDLPMILIEALRHQKVGVMIDREQIGMDVGADRAVEVKDQILWLCESAHIPVIWSTNVLDNLIQSGISKPAEITDAAKAARTECVMLQDGPHVVEAVKLISTILLKMEQHSFKKKNLMRTLSIAQVAKDAIDKRVW